LTGISLDLKKIRSVVVVRRAYVMKKIMNQKYPVFILNTGCDSCKSFRV
jgi:hypothetical protein